MVLCTDLISIPEVHQKVLPCSVPAEARMRSCSCCSSSSSTRNPPESSQSSMALYLEQPWVQEEVTNLTQISGPSARSLPGQPTFTEITKLKTSSQKWPRSPNLSPRSWRGRRLPGC